MNQPLETAVDEKPLIEYVFSKQFKRANAEARLLAPIPQELRDYHFRAKTEDPEEEERQVRPKISVDDERFLFLRYNYAKYRAIGANGEANGFLDSARDTKEVIVNTNMALVIEMAKKIRHKDIEYGDFICEGNMALLRSVEKFDVERGYKFSTYACTCIVKSFARLMRQQGSYRRIQPINSEPELDYWEDFDLHGARGLEGVEEVMSKNRAGLTRDEMEIIRGRFYMPEKMTLVQIGKKMGYSPERVRQMQTSALSKLRCALDRLV